jgi:hypothetical protein
MKLYEYMRWVDVERISKADLEDGLLMEMEEALGVASEQQLAGRLAGCLWHFAKLYPNTKDWKAAFDAAQAPSEVDGSASTCLVNAVLRVSDSPAKRLANFMRAVNQFGYTMPEMIEFSRARLAGEMVEA